MLTQTTLQKIEQENLELFKFKIKSLKKTPFCIKNLRRTIRPFCRTTNLDDTLFSIRLKHSKKAILFSIQQSIQNDTDFNVSITYTTKHKKNVESFLLICSSNFEFLNKVVFLHKLFD